MPAPPRPPRLHHWPEAVRSAELLSGTVVRCGPGLRLASWPETPSVRITALSRWLDHRRIAADLTAAWVWGASAHPSPRPGAPLEFAVLGGKLGAVPEGDAVLHEYTLRPDEVLPIAGFAATAPARTALDLLRSEEFCDRRRLACRLLIARMPGGREALRREISTRRWQPDRRRMIARLDRL